MKIDWTGETHGLHVVVGVNGFDVESFGPFKTGEDAQLYADTLVASYHDVYVAQLLAPETE